MFSEVFVSDKGCNLFALDLRNGGVLCSYKGKPIYCFLGLLYSIVRADIGLSGAVTSIAPSPAFTASVALDRFARIHSNPLPPNQVGEQIEEKGEVRDKVYTKSIPTVIIWDGDTVEVDAISRREEESDEEENVWDGMQNVGDDDSHDDDDDGSSGSKRKGSKKSRATQAL